MSGLGRGKGRGFAEVRETALRRPGQSFASKYSVLINLIENLVINKAVSDKIKIDEIVQTINESIKSSSLKEVLDDLHKQALQDRQFGIKLAVTIGHAKIYSIEYDNCNLRSTLLQILQKDYEDREEIRKKSIVQFRNAISLLGEVYNSLKIVGKPLRLFATPLLQYLELLLETAEEEDIELTATQVSINGQKINEVSPIQLEDFIIKVRAVLINRNLSAKSRGLLLYIIDLASQRFTLISEKLQDLYISEIGAYNLAEIQHKNKDTTVTMKSKNNVNDNNPKNKLIPSSADNTAGNQVRTSKQGRNIDFGGNEKIQQNASIERPSVPRAIRGAGAVDTTKDKNSKKSPRGKKNKLTGEKIWSAKQNTSSKVWGHDDRFDKDYA